MSTFSGTWKITQQWSGIPAYSFYAQFNQDGTIKIPAKDGVGPFFGTYAVLGNQISLAIGAFNKQPYSISSYNGNFVAHSMGGYVVGAQVNGGAITGTWSAIQSELVDAEEKGFFIPAEQLA